MRAMAAGLLPVMSRPLKRMRPAVGVRKWVRRLKHVVLPAPFGPMSAWMVPRRTRRPTFFTARKPRNSLVSPSVSRMTSDVILETEGLTKELRGFLAVKNVGLRVRRGTIHALIGPNGAGKTTCFNLLTHFLTPTAGRIRFNGRDITGSKPAAIARMGLVRSFQISAVFPHLSVLENVRIALQRARGHSFDFWRSASTLHSLDDRARELIEAVGLTDFVQRTAGELPYGRKRALEIATTLALEPSM